MRNAHCRTWNIVRNSEKRAKWTHILLELERDEKT